MSDDRPIPRRKPTRLVSPNWPFPESVVPDRQGIITNVPRPAGRVPLVEEPQGPRKITTVDWPFPTLGPKPDRVS